MPVLDMDVMINAAKRPRFEAVAIEGRGVVGTLDAAWEQVLRSIEPQRET